MTTSTSLPRRAVLAAAFLCAFALPALAGNVKVARFWHNHQPIYWPDWSSEGHVQFAKDSINNGGAHPANNLTDIFGLHDRVQAYQYGPRNSLGACNDSAGYAISYSGSLIDNVRSLGSAGMLEYSSDPFAGFRDACSWTDWKGNRRMDMVGFCYHHALAPVLPKAVFRKEVQMLKQSAWKAWGNNYENNPSRGFFPTEMAFSEEMIDVLADEGYQWVIVASHHFSRTCPTYTNHEGAVASANYNINSSEPNRADMNGPSPTAGWWYNSPNPGNCAWNVAPFAYQLHKVQYVNPSNGTTKTMIAVPSDDVLSYKAGYSGAEMQYADHIAYGATDDNPVIVLPATDGDNAWGGGDSSWMQSWPDFTQQAYNRGWDNTTIQSFVEVYSNNATLAHVEDGAWIFPEMCYGSPYFLKWVDPPCNAKNLDKCYPGTQVDLETPGFALKFWDWAPIIAAANWCETAEKKLGHAEAWRIAAPHEPTADPNAAEKAWHIYLAGLDSGFNYYGGLGNDDECKPPLANLRAIELLRANGCDQAALAATDTVPPSMFRPQRFPYNPGGYTFGWFNFTSQDGNYRKKMGSDFYVWTHVYDVSGIPEDGVKLFVRADNDGFNPVGSIQNETFAGGDEVGEWIEIPMEKRVLPSTTDELNALADNGQINYEFAPAAVADYYFAKVTQFRGQLVDYYVEARDNKGNWTRSDIQHVYVEDDGTPAEGGTGGKRASASFAPEAPLDTDDITVTFDAGTRDIANAATVYCLYSFDAGATWSDKAMTRTSTNTFSLSFKAGEGTYLNDSPSLFVCFHGTVDGTEVWESRNGANWSVSIGDADAPTDGVKISPNPARAGQSVTVSYYPSGRPLSGASKVNVHHGYNGSNWTDAPGDAMTLAGSHWDFSFSVPSSASNLVMCFNDGAVWDNHDSANWTFPVTGTTVPVVPFTGTANIAYASDGTQVPLTVYYNPSGRVLADASSIYVHYGLTDADTNTVWTVAPGAAMSSREGGLYFAATFTPPPGSKTLTVCFNDGTVWDNNSEANWTFDLGTRYPAVSKGIFVTSHADDDPVEAGTAAVSISGTAYGVTGTITWTNAANGATGSFPAADNWTVKSIPLAPGNNNISFSASAPGVTTTTTVAADEAANYDNWTSGSNAGSGFGEWQLSQDIVGSASHFKATTNANLTIGTSAFGLFAANGEMAEAFRTFETPLAAGQTLYWTFENNWIKEDGTPWPYSVGSALQTAEGSTVWQLYFNGGEGTYHQGPDGTATDFPWTGTGLDIAFTLNSNSTYSATVTPLASPSAAQTFTGTVSAPIERLRVWNYSAGPDENYNLYFDNFQLTAVTSTDPVVWASGVRLVRESSQLEISGLSVDASTGDLGVTLDTSIPGTTYYLYVCTDLLASPQVWTPVDSSAVAGTGGPIALTLDLSSADAPFAAYRAGYPLPNP
ncbi:MAG: hypothetical protein IK066_06110 [Kiritimatiellae bacterium]|nr:hypothetical protein [Kiritimatiellia bacterium]